MSSLMYPSKKPKVSQVKEWQTIYSDELHNHWRGDAFNGVVTVSEGRPFPDYLRVVFTPVNSKRVTKYFYGEMAIHQCRRYVSDLGFKSADYAMELM